MLLKIKRIDMFKRNVLIELRRWAEGEYRKPLILRGARQVGKTTIVNEFGKEFDNYLYLNLENSEAVRLFDSPLSIRDLMPMIFLFCNKIKKEGRTLLFIDEIQNSPNAVSKMRYFYEELPEIYVIAAGSLLESLIDVHISFPVGRVEYMAIRPCSFIEFLGAIGEEQLIECLKNVDYSISFHGKLIELFKIYILIGGMPEVIKRYAEKRDVLALGNVYETLLTGYKDDIEKYAKGKTQSNVIRYILNEGWTEAGKSITLGGFAGSPYKAREVGDAFRTLEKTFILELVYPVTEMVIPAISDMKRSPKLIWQDVGLVNYAANIQKEILGTKDITDAWRGMVAEQVVAQELLTLTNKVSAKRNFWVRNKKGSPAEIDFIWIYDSKIIPIEVKSGNNAHLKSIHSFIDRSPNNLAIRVWSQPFSVNRVKTDMGKVFTLINLPFYLVGSLTSIFPLTIQLHPDDLLEQILLDYGYKDDSSDTNKKNNAGKYEKCRFMKGKCGVLFDRGNIRLISSGIIKDIGFKQCSPNKIYPFLFFYSLSGEIKNNLTYLLKNTISYSLNDLDKILQIDDFFNYYDVTVMKGKTLSLYLEYKEIYLTAKKEFLEKYQLFY